MNHKLLKIYLNGLAPRKISLVAVRFTQKFNNKGVVYILDNYNVEEFFLDIILQHACVFKNYELLKILLKRGISRDLYNRYNSKTMLKDDIKLYDIFNP